MTSTLDPVEIAKSAKKAFEASQIVEHDERVRALVAIRESLGKCKEDIMSANRRDMEVSFPSLPPSLLN